MSLQRKGTEQERPARGSELRTDTELEGEW